MGEWSEIPKILKSTRTDALVWAITFIFTTMGDLDAAIKLGFLAAALLYIQRIASTTTVTHQSHVDFQNDIQKEQVQVIPTGAGFLTIHGPFLFGTTDQLTRMVDHFAELPDVLILRLNQMTAIDATGIQALEHFIEEAKKQSKHIILSEIKPQPEKQIQKMHIDELIGKLNLCPTLASAINRARDITGENLTENNIYALAERELLPHRN
jgi:SulP family sulfate permease